MAFRLLWTWAAVDLCQLGEGFDFHDYFSVAEYVRAVQLLQRSAYAGKEEFRMRLERNPSQSHLNFQTLL